MASSVNPLGSSYTGNGVNTQNQNNQTGLGGSVPSESTFLTLLVSQLKNQDPLNPTDSTTFVTQLAQFSELEQVIGIKGDTDAIAKANQTATTTDTTAGQTTNQTSNN
ncbi:MAG TPA: flagellar hook capping FlgD N-terminal domain-containing protein [Bryobacteraceae bacterium]|nr:flagellar hook capping FlgD N-terminal domain-containing protein [Bryobacteraceae bacterium]